jgi:hypothetical protein
LEPLLEAGGCSRCQEPPGDFLKATCRIDQHLWKQKRPIGVRALKASYSEKNHNTLLDRFPPINGPLRRILLALPCPWAEQQQLNNIAAALRRILAKLGAGAK